MALFLWKFYVENHAFGFQKFVRDLQPCNPCSRKSGPNVEWFHATRSLLLADPKLADEFETVSPNWCMCGDRSCTTISAMFPPKTAVGKVLNSQDGARSESLQKPMIRHVESEVNRVALGKGEHCNVITVYKGKDQQLAQWFGQVMGVRSFAAFGRSCKLPGAKKLLSMLVL
ncbi:hypothetical protein H0E87_011900 [Populus deltoides]|uniref:Uncharacterized protein n=1 Tax=Populus deltoides TaxID=3696 RepID=A0A8T2YH25_POPDE|nr:hypothetical protein H0E87_011900 [Populus deltoides]